MRARIGTALAAADGNPRSSITAAIGIDTFIVSGLPFVNFPDGLRNAIWKQIQQALNPEGRYVQYHFSGKLYRKYQKLFHDVLLRSYQETLDCPEVNGVRTMEEVVTGHRSQGRHAPSRWWLAWHEKTAAGVLLLTELEDVDGWDLSYVGVVPEGHSAVEDDTVSLVVDLVRRVDHHFRDVWIADEAFNRTKARDFIDEASDEILFVVAYEARVVLGQEGPVAALFHDGAILHHYNAVGEIAYRR